MTANQLRFQQNVETQRANLENERLTQLQREIQAGELAERERHNKKTESLESAENIRRNYKMFTDAISSIGSGIHQRQMDTLELADGIMGAIGKGSKKKK